MEKYTLADVLVVEEEKLGVQGLIRKDWKDLNDDDNDGIVATRALPDEEYKCTKCPENFSLSIQLEEHMRIVHGAKRAKKRVQCEECSKIFASAAKLRAHVEREHGSRHKNTGNYQLHRCEICDQVFNRQDKFNTHMKRIHMKYLRRFLRGFAEPLK
ncbi:zinc finger protein 43-like [Phlebotomus argentipes]|uniref:zinc finger protein 43-like n=1 Tax=Phlebotomus argentipes TaxID=94469 RepID=UPI002892C89D|nr:zinc finger protein 43-like [Phlebotomus argentipes]